MREIALSLVFGGLGLFSALPATDNYKLHDYGFGSGGGSSSSANYSLDGLAGDISGGTMTSDNYGLKSGQIGARLANLPDAPTWQNPGDWYNKLELVINTSGNPDDTTYAVAISDDNFVTTRYVQSDSTVGDALGTEDFRDYTAWGGAGGMSVIGLSPDTSYSVRVKALQGETSETGFGPQATASTEQVDLVFDIDIAATDIESAAPYNLDFGTVSPGITDNPELIWLDIDSNAENGAFVYIVSDNNGLASTTASHTIDSTTGDLSSLDEGIGAQNSSVSETAGGPLSVTSPYDGSSDNIGAINDQFSQLLSSSLPLESGRASFLLKLKTSIETPAANDYLDIYTVIASAAF